jgi:hypothetical protein
LAAPKIFIVYVACPGDEADKFLLPLDQNFFFACFFANKFYFFDEKTLKSPITPKPLEQF